MPHHFPQFAVAWSSRVYIGNMLSNTLFFSFGLPLLLVSLSQSSTEAS